MSAEKILMSAEKILTVAELIQILKTLPQDLPVWHEGCDCWGSADGAEVQTGDEPRVLITRGNK